MKVVIVFVLALSVCVEVPTTAQARNSCSKDCRDFQRACVKAHSQAACKTDYDICMKHCKEK
jgi:hypothetical protein